MNEYGTVDIFFVGFGILNLVLAVFCKPLSKFLAKISNKFYYSIEDKLDAMERKGWERSKEGFIIKQSQLEKTLLFGGLLNIVGLITFKVWVLPLF